MNFDTNRSVDNALLRWVPRAMLRGKVPFNPAKIALSLDDGDRKRLILEFDTIAERLSRINWDDGHWKLPALDQGAIPVYVPPGDRFRSRLVNAGLYGDRVIVHPPDNRSWGIRYQMGGESEGETAEYLRILNGYGHWTQVQGNSQAANRPVPCCVTENGQEREVIDDELEDLITLLEEEKERLLMGWPHLRAELPHVCREVLEYWWDVREPLAEGWLQVAPLRGVNHENIREICRDPEFSAKLPDWRTNVGRMAGKAWHTVLTSAGIGQSLGRSRVGVVPGSSAESELLELTDRYFVELPYGGTFVGALAPTPRACFIGDTEIQRGLWFDQLLVGLGPAARHLDMDAVCDLKREGLAASFRRWVSGDLARIAFQAETERAAAITECRHQLNQIAAAVDAQIRKAANATVRDRLKQAGIWGTSGAATGYLGAVLTGSAIPVALPVAAIGFGVGALGGAAATAQGVSATAEPVLYQVLSRAAMKRRNRKRVR